MGWKILHLPTAILLKQFGKLASREHAQSVIDRHFFYRDTYVNNDKIIVKQRYTTYSSNSPIKELHRCEFEPVEVVACGK